MNRKISHWKAAFVVPREAADAFSDALENAFHPETFAITTGEAEPGSSPLVKTASEWNEVEAHGLWRIEALYMEEPETDAIRALLMPVEEETGITAADLAIEAVEEEDWIAKSLEGLAPVSAGRFFVYGSHDADKVPASGVPILIEAGLRHGAPRDDARLPRIHRQISETPAPAEPARPRYGYGRARHRPCPRDA